MTFYLICGFFWIVCGIVHYVLFLRNSKRQYPEIFEENLTGERITAAVTAFGGPISLILDWWNGYFRRD